MNPAIILTVLLSLPPAQYGPPEAPKARAERLTTIARTIYRAARGAVAKKDWPGSAAELAGTLVTVGWWESRFARHIHAGKCRVRLGECDPARRRGRLVPLARTIYQLQRTTLVAPYWKQLAGLSPLATYRASWGAARVLSLARRSCARGARWLAPTLSRYATGKSCRWRKVGPRVAWYARVWLRRPTTPSRQALALLRG